MEKIPLCHLRIKDEYVDYIKNSQILITQTNKDNHITQQENDSK